MRPRRRKVGEVLAELAGNSHGVVTRGELLEAGITDTQIRSRLRAGSLLRVHPGVYRVGYRSTSVEATYLAAVKAAGTEALLAGRAAGYLFGLLRGGPPQPEVISKGQRRPRGVIVRRRAAIVTADVTEWRGVPVTTIPRTLVDLAGVLSESELARAVHEADARHHTTPEHIDRVLMRRHNWPGRRKLRRVIGGDVPVTLSRLESRFLERIRAARLPLPDTNSRVDGRYVDCRWLEHGLTVELDSYRYHNTNYAWEQDREREREARARGDEHRRYTWRDVDEKPEPMLADLRRLLGS
ncbi:MAG TPA: type IV toxin-antitoxin system AbiEi family antitoxin domain-containing protein [Solirubrobacterales bacterium]